MRKALFIIAIWVVAPAAAWAQGLAEAPVYQRTRGGADQAPMQGPSGPWGSGHAGSGYGGYRGFYNPYFAAPTVTGAWYQRPYPYHFDYYRYRWNAPPAEVTPPHADCPCAGAGETGPAL